MDRIKPGIKVLAYHFIPISFISVEAQCEKCGANGYSLYLSQYQKLEFELKGDYIHADGLLG